MLEGCGLITFQCFNACFSIDVKYRWNMVFVCQIVVVLQIAADKNVSRRKYCETPSGQLTNMFSLGSERRRRPRQKNEFESNERVSLTLEVEARLEAC